MAIESDLDKTPVGKRGTIRERLNKFQAMATENEILNRMREIKSQYGCICPTCQKPGVLLKNGSVMHLDERVIHIIQKEPFAKEFKRLQEVFHLWVIGIASIIGIGIFILGFQNIFYLLVQAYGLALVLLGIIVIPILVALFILPRFGIEIER